MIKSGFQSSEFYVALLGIVGIIVGFLQQKCNFNTTDVLTLGGLIVAYIGSRTYLKAQQPTNVTTTTPTSTTTITTGTVPVVSTNV